MKRKCKFIIIYVRYVGYDFGKKVGASFGAGAEKIFPLETVYSLCTTLRSMYLPRMMEFVLDQSSKLF